MLSSPKPKRAGRGGDAELQPLPKIELKKTDVIETMISNVLSDVPYSRNQLLKSADFQYIGISKNKIKLGKCRWA